MTSKTLTVTIDAVDVDTFALICAQFYRSCFEYSFCHSIVHPHKMQFKFGPLSEIGVENVKIQWRSFGLENGTFYEEDWKKFS